MNVKFLCVDLILQHSILFFKKAKKLKIKKKKKKRKQSARIGGVLIGIESNQPDYFFLVKNYKPKSLKNQIEPKVSVQHNEWNEWKTKTTRSSTKIC